MNNIHDLVSLLMPELVNTEPVKPQFFCIFDTTSGKVFGISANDECSEHQQSFPVDYDLAISFLNGTENFNDWEVVPYNGTLSLKKRNFLNEYKSRVDLITVCEYTEAINSNEQYPDINVVFDHTDDVVKIFYDGDMVKRSASKPATLFFTKDGDPTHLLFSVKLDINTLDKVMLANNLSSWPNPLTIKTQEHIDNISMFAHRYIHKIKLTHDYDKHN